MDHIDLHIIVGRMQDSYSEAERLLLAPLTCTHPDYVEGTWRLRYSPSLMRNLLGLFHERSHSE